MISHFCILNTCLFFFLVQERLHEKEQTIHELERRMEEKDRELHAIKLDNEAVCHPCSVLLSLYFWCSVHSDLISYHFLDRLGLKRTCSGNKTTNWQHSGMSLVDVVLCHIFV